jgi:hypothetical protein
MCLKVVLPTWKGNLKFEATNEMKLSWPLRKNKIVKLMWFEGEPISLISLVRGHVHNDDGSIWDIYYVEEKIFWDFFHCFSVGVVPPKALSGIQTSILYQWIFFTMVIHIVNHGCNLFDISHNYK